MSRYRWDVILLCFLATILISGRFVYPQSEFDRQVLPDTIDGIPRQDMMRTYLIGKVESLHKIWQSNFEKRINDGTSETYYHEMKTRFVSSVGGFPARTPLNPVITGVTEGDGFRIEKIIFESRPGHFVTANLYLPEKTGTTGTVPGVLVPCGHYKNSKAHDEYQLMGALLSLNGMAALVYDPIDQGERLQIRNKTGAFPYWGTRAHTINDVRAILLGESTAGYMIWDGMRAIDYLVSRPEIDPARIGCTGNSGGGTQTAYLMALDDRIKVAAPSCYIHHLESQIKNSMGDAEQNIYGQLAFGMDHPDYIMMRAPLPVRLLAATHDFFRIEAVWETFRSAKRYYTALGFSGNVDIMENNAGHNYNRQQRESAAAWLARWLLGRDTPVHEPELTIYSDQELRCTLTGQSLDLEGALSVQALQIAKLDACLLARKERAGLVSKDALRDTIRQLTGIRRFEQIPMPATDAISVDTLANFRIEKLIIRPEPGIRIPMIRYRPLEAREEAILLYLHQEGKHRVALDDEAITKLTRAGNQVVMADLRGIGETAQTGQAKMGKLIALDWVDWYTAYLMGENYVAMRCEDLFSCVRALQQYETVPVRIVASGNVGIPALHACALEPALFKSLELEECIGSWEEIIRSTEFYNQLDGVVRGALQYYDLPDLAGLSGLKVSIRNPADVNGITEQTLNKMDKLSAEPVLPGLAGIWYGSLDLVDPVGFDPISDLEQSWDQTAQRGRTWSAEWFGAIIAPESGSLTLELSTDQAVRLRIGDPGQIISANKEAPRATAILEVSKGKPYPVYMHYNQDSSDSGSVSLRWRINGREVSHIPAEFLRHSEKEKYRMDTAGR